MSTALFFLVPIGMFAVVWGFFFVGCKFPTTGTFNEKPYSNQILADTTTLVAYWPLNDVPGPTPTPPPTGSKGVGTALDFSGNGHHGSYLVPPAYPSVATSTPFADPMVTLQQPSIVPGDAVQSGSKVLPSSAEFTGGYVSIPWIGPPASSSFTLEAWVKPNWTGMGFNWVVFSALFAQSGFSVFVNDKNLWQVNLGVGSAIVPTAFVPADLDGITYVAVTFDNTKQTLSLWLNPDGNAPLPVGSVGSLLYSPVDAGENPPATFFIGAGANNLPLRTLPQVNGNSAPLYPFQGWIQSVALYSNALSPTDLGQHFAAGSGLESG